LAIIKFFSPENVGDLIDPCIDLSLVFHCSPYAFLDKPSDEIERLFVAVDRRLKVIRSMNSD
jgi:hypothetical protein